MMEDLSLHILDIAENAIAAGARRIAISINENQKQDRLTIRITDNGKGMSKSALKKAVDPFFTTKQKKTGLGLALFAQAAQMSDGELRIKSRPRQGTTVEAKFRSTHIDLQPLTKMAETILGLVIGHPEIDFRYQHRRNRRLFVFDSGRVKKGFDRGLPPTPEGIRKVRTILVQGLKKLARS